jgi:hypothetical protein
MATARAKHAIYFAGGGEDIFAHREIVDRSANPFHHADLLVTGHNREGIGVAGIAGCIPGNPFAA